MVHDASEPLRKRNVVGEFRPRKRKVKAEKPVPPPKPPKVAKPKPARKVCFSVYVGRWLLACGYRYCGPGAHVVCGEAYTTGARCKACNQVRCAAWRAVNPERVKATLRKYRETHREVQRAATTKWQASNPEKRKAQQKRWYDSMRADPVRWRARLDRDLKQKALKNPLQSVVDIRT